MPSGTIPRISDIWMGETSNSGSLKSVGQSGGEGGAVGVGAGVGVGVGAGSTVLVSVGAGTAAGGGVGINLGNDVAVELVAGATKVGLDISVAGRTAVGDRCGWTVEVGTNEPHPNPTPRNYGDESKSD